MDPVKEFGLSADWKYMGDVNMEDYGGKFYRKVPESTAWHVIVFDNWDDCSGEPGPGNTLYNVSLRSVDVNPSASDRKSALSCVGLREDTLGAENDPYTREWMLVDALVSAGTYDMVHQWDGDDAAELLRYAENISYET